MLCFHSRMNSMAAFHIHTMLWRTINITIWQMKKLSGMLSKFPTTTPLGCRRAEGQMHAAWPQSRYAKANLWWAAHGLGSHWSLPDTWHVDMEELLKGLSIFEQRKHMYYGERNANIILKTVTLFNWHLLSITTKQPLWHALMIYRHGPCSPNIDILVWEIEINK